MAILNHNNAKIVNALIKAKADLEVKNNDGKTALMLAFERYYDSARKGRKSFKKEDKKSLNALLETGAIVPVGSPHGLEKYEKSFRAKAENRVEAFKEAWALPY